MAPKRIIRTTLDPNAWEGLCPALPAFKRPLYVATPCIGIDGCGTALDALGVRYQANNVYDLEHRYQAYLTQHLGGNVQLHLGKKDGDLCQLQLSDVERPVDLLVSGPPCPPWAGQGNHKGQHDHRADVFIVVMKVCIALIKVGDLHACCIENVKGILAKIKGSTCSFMDQILHILRQECAEFQWGVHTLQASSYLLAQQRTRVFLRAPLTSFGSRQLQEFLSPDLPNCKLETLTEVMQKNLKDAQAHLKAMLQDGHLDAADLVVFPLDRADGKAYKRSYTTNLVPTLTTNNTYLFVVSLDFSRPNGQPKLLRFLHPSERMVLQGFSPSVLEGSSDTLRVKASGNAYPVPLMMAVLHGVLHQLAGRIPQKTKVVGSLLDQAVADACHNFEVYMDECSQGCSGGSPQTKAMKRPAAKAKAAKKAPKKKPAKGSSKTVKKASKKKTPIQRRQYYKYRFLSSSSS